METEVDGDPRMSRLRDPWRGVYMVGDWRAVALVTIIIVIT